MSNWTISTALVGLDVIETRDDVGLPHGIASIGSSLAASWL
jgi:hypothetical protein